MSVSSKLSDGNIQSDNGELTASQGYRLTSLEGFTALHITEMEKSAPW